jgi:SnoaL-like domain
MSPSDELAIANLIHRYAELFDAGDLEGAAGLFTHAVIRAGDTELDATSPLALWRRLVQIHADGTPRTSHVTTNLVIEVAAEDDTATCRAKYTVFQATDTLPLQAVVAGSYADTFAKVDGSWRFASRTYGLDLRGNLTQHLRHPV